MQGKQDLELNAEYESRERIPRIKIKTPMLIQPSQVYIFERFQIEYEKSIAAYARVLNGNRHYHLLVNRKIQPFMMNVAISNPLEQTTTLWAN